MTAGPPTRCSTRRAVRHSLWALLLVGIGLWVRLKLTETPAFAAALEESPPPKVPVAEAMRTHPLQMFGGTFAAIACFAIFYLATAFALGYGTTKLGIAREDFLGVQLVAILFMAAGIIVSGYWADHTRPAQVLGWGCAAMFATSFLTGPWLGSGDLFLTGAYLSLILFVMGLVYGPLGAWLPGLFPARVRYTGASICFNAAGILGGALAPNIALKLSERGLEYVGYYLAVIALISLFGLFLLKSRDQSAV